MSAATDRTAGLARSAIMVAGVSAVTLLLTVGWQMAIARTFGASTELDAFWVALGIPRALADSFHLGLLTLLFVLVFRRQSETPGDRWRRASAVLNVTLVVTAVVIGLLVALAPMLVRLMAPGLTPANQQLSASLLRQLSLMLVGTAIAAAVGGVAIASEQLLPFTLSRAAIPAAQIVVMLSLAAALGVRALVWALWAGAASAVIMFVPWLRRIELRYYRGFGWRDPETRHVLGLQAVLGTIWLLILLNQLVDRYLASLLGPGHVSALEFAWRFEIPISQIVSLGVALPTFALLAQSGADRRDEFRATLAASARLLVLTVVPMLAFIVVMRVPLASLWFGRGAFTPDAVQLVASLLPSLAVVYFCRAFASVLVFGLLMVGRARLLVIGLTLELILHAVLGRTLSAAMGLSGVTLASAIAMFAVNGGLWVVLLRSVDALAPATILGQFRRYVLAALAAAVLLKLGQFALDAIVPGISGFAALVPLVIIGVIYLFVYVVACVLTGLLQLQSGRTLPRLAIRSLDS